jgi:hypothetical protein
MRKRLYKKREFITDDRAQSVIRYKVSYTPSRMVKHWETGEPYQDGPSINCHLTMSDCFRSIDWDFSEDDALPKLKKARKLLNEFFTRTEAAIKDYNRESKRIERKRGSSNSISGGDF